MMMTVPVGRFDMYFNVSGPDVSVDGDFGIEKVGSRVGV